MNDELPCAHPFGYDHPCPRCGYSGGNIVVQRPGDPPPSCQHLRIDNTTGCCEACGEHMIIQHVETETVLSAPDAAPCRDPRHLAAIASNEDFDCNHIYVPDYSRARVVVIGWNYSYECQRCPNDGTLFNQHGIIWDCGHSHKGQFVTAKEHAQ